MELIKFRDQIYGKHLSELFLFDTLWESFRPINGVVWNGEALVVDDSRFKLDLFDENYGYGSTEKKRLCKYLTENTEISTIHEFSNPIEFWKWSGQQNVKWWKDRPIVFENSCIDRETNSWKNYLRYLNSRAKTLRRSLKGRLTRRLVPK
jgi:hypothetical protein